jgi:hypothetical protein
MSSVRYATNTTLVATSPVSLVTPQKAHTMTTTRTMPVAFTNSAVPVEVMSIPEPQQKPHLVPVEAPRSNKRHQANFLIRTNRALQTALVAMCGIAIFAYGLDVVVSHDVGRLQEQARRLSEQNSELSAQLLKAISYGELQDSVVGRFALHVPDQVAIVKEIEAPPALAYRTHRHHLPLMSGY